jgi:RimJ/RimL family protein N-acetyltransferase
MEINQNKITFRLATLIDHDLIKTWWTKPHVMEFWDNSKSMWENVENYLRGKKDLFDYWIGYLDGKPFSLLMTSEFEKNQPIDNPYVKWIDPNGLTMSIDFMIGDEQFLGKGLGSNTLIQFSDLLHQKGVTALLIDPAENNPRAIHVYQKSGFEIVETFERSNGYFSGIKHYLMKKTL